MKNKLVFTIASIFFLILVINMISAEIINSCSSDSDCKVDACIKNSCFNVNSTRTPAIGCAVTPDFLADYCKCENNICKGYKNQTKNKTCDLSDPLKCDKSCTIDSDCAPIGPCNGCYNKDVNFTNKLGIAYSCAADTYNQLCECKNNQCIKKEQLVGNDSDSHGCKPSAGYSWCVGKQKCLRPWEENCSTNETCAKEGEELIFSDHKECCSGLSMIITSKSTWICTSPICGNGICEYGEDEECNQGGCNPCIDCSPKIKFLPDVASQRARERLGELGFNITLKEVGQDKQPVYVASAEKQGKMLGLFKIKAKVSAEIDAETGVVLKVHKPWWSFMAGI